MSLRQCRLGFGTERFQGEVLSVNNKDAKENDLNSLRPMGSFSVVLSSLGIRVLAVLTR